MIYGLDSPLGLDSLWGGPGELGTWGCSLSDSRSLVQMPIAGNFRRWICAFASEPAAELDTVFEMRDSFDLSFAVGDQLDKIGAWIGLPRQGIVSDERYRVWLTIQALLLSGLDVGKGHSILALTRLFVGPSADPIILINGQYVYELDFPDFEFGTEVPQLIRFLRLATWAAVLGVIFWNLGGVWGYDELSSIAVADEGLWAYDEGNTIDVPDHMIWSSIFTTDP